MEHEHPKYLYIDHYTQFQKKIQDILETTVAFETKITKAHASFGAHLRFAKRTKPHLAVGNFASTRRTDWRLLLDGS